ncbi:MAG: ChaN family lipoprotein, partial [Myxococcales bacterium]|nr:ChaN family lipoprotein [Myxococcales bacterium]
MGRTRNDGFDRAMEHVKRLAADVAARGRGRGVVSDLVMVVAAVVAFGCASAGPRVERGPLIQRSHDLYRLPLAGDSRIAHEIRLRPGEVIDTDRLLRLTGEQLRRRVRGADVVLVGERHDSLADHHLQWRVMRLLEPRKPAIGLEMLPYTKQPTIDRYLRGEISEREMLRRIDWRRTWGFDVELYRPFWRFARRIAAPLLALNEPASVVRQVGRHGLASLSPEIRRRLPTIDLSSTAHRALFFYMIGGLHHHRGGRRPSPHHGSRFRGRMRHFYEAQSLWDEAMAARVLAQLRRESGRPVLVIAGKGHLLYGLG